MKHDALIDALSKLGLELEVDEELKDNFACCSWCGGEDEEE